jgi:hypothetical protein
MRIALLLFLLLCLPWSRDLKDKIGRRVQNKGTLRSERGA